MTTARSLRGGAVGALTAALAVAAHGVGGGGIPSSSALTFLVVIAAAIGVLAGSVAPHRHGHLPVVLWLVGGQLIAHETLAAVTPHTHPAAVEAPVHVLGGPMLTAHGVAIAAGALLIVAAERLIAVVTSAIATPAPLSGALPRHVAIVATAPLDRPVPIPRLSAVSRRGPPSVLALRP